MVAKVIPAGPEPIIVNSNFAKKELSKVLDIKSKKIFVNYLGVKGKNLKDDKKDNIKLTKGGNVCDIMITKTGVQIRCKCCFYN